MAWTWPYLSAHFPVTLKAQTCTFVLRKPKLLSLYQIMSPISFSVRVHLIVVKTRGQKKWGRGVRFGGEKRGGRGGGRKWQGLEILSLGPLKHNVSKSGRKLERKEGLYSMDNFAPILTLSSSPFCFVLFCFLFLSSNLFYFILFFKVPAFFPTSI